MVLRFIDLFAGIGGIRKGLELAAMDMQKLVVIDGKGLRKLSLREGLRLFGYPEDYQFDVSEKEGFDLLGNTVVVPVIKAVCNRLIKTLF